MQWYTKQKQASRVNVWFSFNGFGQILGGAVAYGIAVGTERNGSSISSWKIVFLFTGLLTVVLGGIFLWIVPDSQLNARWLKKEDRVLAIFRVRVNQQGIGNKHFKLYQVKEALMDPMTWAFFFFALIADIPNGGITNFFSQLVIVSLTAYLHQLTITDHKFRLFIQTKSPLRHPRWRRRSHCPPRQRLHQPYHPTTHPMQHRRSHLRNCGHGPYRRLTSP